MRRISAAEQFENSMNSAFRSLDYQLAEQRNCECWFHRYHVAHICECGALYYHSQSACDDHRGHDCISFDSGFVQHGDTVARLYAA